jgi:periplasmic protein TonB
MEANKILSADWLDLLFDERNKAYGAYELRKTYSKRITRALLITGSITLLVFTGAVLANSVKPENKEKFVISAHTIQEIKPDEELPEPVKPLEKKPEVQIRTEALASPEIVKDDEVVEPPPSQDDLANAKIDVIKQDGVDDQGIADVKVIDDGKGIVEGPKNDGPKGPFEKVEIDAKFSGDWERFLRKYLNPDVAVENGAPPGRHTVLIQFVVDIDGSVSDIRPLTNIGYGMEQEAIRVLKKAAKWIPAVQNGQHVQAYRRQPITFEVME